MKKELIEFLKECIHNSNVNYENGNDNFIDLDYVIERLKDILINDILKD